MIDDVKMAHMPFHSNGRIKDNQTILLLAAILAAIVFIVSGATIYYTYETSFEQQRVRLMEIARSQARLMEAVRKYNASSPQMPASKDASAATLAQFKEAHKHFEGFGKTGEFTLAKLEDNHIIFLLSHRHPNNFGAPKDHVPVPMGSKYAVPMQLALSGKSGTVIGLDYRGQTVLAAHEPVANLNWGIVAKIDLKEVQAPFIKVGLWDGGGALVLIIVGILLFRRFGGPLIEHLEQSNEWLRAIFNASRDGIMVEDNEHIFFANQALTQLYGYDRPEELLGKHLSVVLHPKDKERLLEYGIRRQQGEPTPSLYEFKGKRKDGSIIELEASVSVAIVTGKTYITAVIRDISRRKQVEKEKAQLEQQLRQAQKLETIGTLAGGIAHDFNNLLTPVLGYVDMALDEVPEGSQIHSDLEEVVKAATRAKDLVKQILAFSRQDERRRTPVRIEIVLRETLKLLRATLPTTIEMRQGIEPDCGTVLADSAHIQQVLMNLCTNAAHAMKENGGVLAVDLRSANMSADFVRLHPTLGAGKYVQLTVKDTGQGMSRAVQERIFEPFFTTKGVDEGTGLGLSVVHGIVMSYGGEITVSSTPGQGTTFTVYLPVHGGEVESDFSPNPPMIKGKENILFVDDEQAVCKVGKRILEKLGYSVTTRTSSVEALETFRSHPYKFDLVITDQTMPNKTGVQLAAELGNIRADLPIILMTGYSDTITPENMNKFGIREYVMKPISSRDINQAIRHVLEQKEEQEA